MQGNGCNRHGKTPALHKDKIPPLLVSGRPTSALMVVLLSSSPLGGGVGMFTVSPICHLFFITVSNRIRKLFRNRSNPTVTKYHRIGMAEHGYVRGVCLLFCYATGTHNLSPLSRLNYKLFPNTDDRRDTQWPTWSYHGTASPIHDSFTFSKKLKVSVCQTKCVCLICLDHISSQICALYFHNLCSLDEYEV